MSITHKTCILVILSTFFVMFTGGLDYLDRQVRIDRLSEKSFISTQEVTTYRVWEGKWEKYIEANQSVSIDKYVKFMVEWTPVALLLDLIVLILMLYFRNPTITPKRKPIGL